MSNSTHARISFDQAMGRTLDVNHITVDEAISGDVKWISSIPEAIQ